MAQAVLIYSTPLSDLMTNPFVREAFQRAERDLGQAFAVPADQPRTLDGGALEQREVAHA